MYALLGIFLPYTIPHYKKIWLLERAFLQQPDTITTHPKQASQAPTLGAFKFEMTIPINFQIRIRNLKAVSLFFHHSFIFCSKYR